jgi:hypothetical protein
LHSGAARNSKRVQKESQIVVFAECYQMRPIHRFSAKPFYFIL